MKAYLPLTFAATCLAGLIDLDALYISGDIYVTEGTLGYPLIPPSTEEVQPSSVESSEASRTTQSITSTSDVQNAVPSTSPVLTPVTSLNTMTSHAPPSLPTSHVSYPISHNVTVCYEALPTTTWPNSTTIGSSDFSYDNVPSGTDYPSGLYSTIENTTTYPEYLITDQPHVSTTNTYVNPPYGTGILPVTSRPSTVTSSAGTVPVPWLFSVLVGGFGLLSRFCETG
ncbi:uncharacterized protein B0I36DRAFT_350541 [Microdochium trichocladiopsis]|uniref:Uncharacterized protein n=1 Tax=Microdochium trichocladiopsis TaxID=1682393 RepID=A0A9P8Y7B4_9PEZI|nr:uncharacterized protein B0I36DRAFT_350541 [Microdochium trichocladiopsis]KAH7029713.1 hypothetical protein B0I36DRAFT_350541 [Microdochium trichocladiopsis]